MNVSEAATVQQLATGVDRVGKGVSKVVACAVDAGDLFPLFNATITCSPAAQDIEVL